jgi:hypothetical protein
LYATAIVLMLLLAVLGITGLFIEGDWLLGVMNVDLPIDLLRLAVVIAVLVPLLRKDAAEGALRAILVGVGALYLVMGLVALGDPTFGGIAPTGFTRFDIVLHLMLGAVLLAVGLVRRSRQPRVTDAPHPAVD